MRIRSLWTIHTRKCLKPQAHTGSINAGLSAMRSLCTTGLSSSARRAVSSLNERTRGNYRELQMPSWSERRAYAKYGGELAVSAAGSKDRAI